jgi:hypothetical protein
MDGNFNMNYHRIIYLGDQEHFNLFKTKYYNHPLLQYVSIIRCNSQLFWTDERGVALDYKDKLLSGVLFIYQENFSLYFSSKNFLQKLFWNKKKSDSMFFNGLNGVHKNKENAYTVESAFSVNLYFIKEEEKKYSRFEQMEIE